MKKKERRKKRGRNEDNSQEHVQFCLECSSELGKLTKLEQELKGIKKKIESQITKINRRRAAFDKDGQGQRNLFPKVPKMQISLAGSVTGTENISQALGFLTTLCNGMPSGEPTSGPLKSPKIEPSVDVQRRPPDDVDADMQVEEEDLNAVTGVIKTEILSENYVETSMTSEDNDTFLLPHDDPDETETLMDPLTLPIPFTGHSKTTKATGSKAGETGNGKQKRRPRGTRPWFSNCTVCGKEVRTKTMKLHMVVHTGERKYGCPECGKAFTQTSSVRKHRTSVHGVNLDNVDVKWIDLSTSRR